MDKQSDLKSLLIDHQEATIDMLWNKVYDIFRYLNDIAGLSKDNDVLAYLKSINKEEPDYRQDITVNNKNIDLVLKRYMLEAAMLNISVDFHIEPLENLSTESIIEILKSLDECFEKIFDYRGSSRAFLYIKAKKDSVQIYAEKVEKSVFDKEIMLEQQYSL